MFAGVLGGRIARCIRRLCLQVYYGVVLPSVLGGCVCRCIRGSYCQVY